MSLQLAAKHLADKGRGPDSTLVHMSTDELNSLQALAKAHGGAITINPDTGLPEAGFLSKILPMIAGAALTATGVGAPIAALMVGGGMTAATGSLQKGLMAGLGAYGGYGLTSGLANLGTGAISQAAGAGLSEEAAQQAIGNKLAQSTMTDQLTAGAKYAFDNPMNALKGIGGGSAMKGIGTIGMAAAPLLAGMGEGAQAPGIKPTTPTTPLQFNPGRVGPTPAPDVPGYGNQGQNFGREQRYFNPSFTPINQPAPVASIAPITTMPIIGGMASGGPVEDMSISNVYDMQNARGGVSDMGIDNSTGMQRMAGGGISHLGDYSDGGRLLRGPGDGVSDDIPAMIGEKQPARLADGEFVIPARIVGELGNGSTEAGARKLYAMMDRIQENRKKTIGEDNIAVDSHSDRYLPA